MAKLRFNNEGLKRLLAENKASTKFRNNYGHAIAAWEKEHGRKFDYQTDNDSFNGSTVNGNSAKYFETDQSSFWLVKDQGIYLMSAAKDKPVDLKNGGSFNVNPFVVYAKGYEPKGDDWYSKCRNAVGGDDFCEQIDVTEFVEKYINEGCDLIVNLTATQIKIGFEVKK